MADYLNPYSNRYLKDLQPLPDLAGQAAAELLSGPAPSPLSAQATSSTQTNNAGTLALLAQMGALGSKSQGGSSGGGKGPGGSKDRTSHGKGIGAKGLPNKMSNSVAQNRRLAKSVINKRYSQWNQKDYRDLVSLWNRESGWRANADNPTSSAYGIPQAMLSVHNVGKDFMHSPLAQILWGLRYIKGRYGSPSGAWAHSQQTGWY